MSTAIDITRGDWTEYVAFEPLAETPLICVNGHSWAAEHYVSNNLVGESANAQNGHRAPYGYNGTLDYPDYNAGNLAEYMVDRWSIPCISTGRGSMRLYVDGSSASLIHDFGSWVTPFNPGGVLLIAGANDLGVPITAETYIGYMDDYLELCRSAGIKLWVLDMTPSTAADSARHYLADEFNDRLYRWGRERGVPIIGRTREILGALRASVQADNRWDINAAWVSSVDTAHPNAAGFAILAKAVMQQMEMGLVNPSDLPAPVEMEGARRYSGDEAARLLLGVSSGKTTPSGAFLSPDGTISRLSVTYAGSVRAPTPNTKTTPI